MIHDSQEGTVGGLVDGSFRHSAGRVTARLNQLTGWKFLDDTEDSVQDAFLAALRHWPHRGVPENRDAWLYQVAKNALIDRIRRSSADTEFDQGEADLDATTYHTESAFEPENRVSDDLLRAILIASHPSLPRESQVTLTLRLVCGFSVGELSRLLMIQEESVTRRVTRAKEQLRETVRGDIGCSIAELVDQRVSGVVDVVYQIFTAGHTAPVGETLVREDLMDEAIYLAGEVDKNSPRRFPPLVALRSLIHFHKSRIRARLTESGELATLEEQDRARWDKEQIVLGFRYLHESQGGDHLSEYHLQAAIASIHASASSYAETDWNGILSLYDILIELNPSPILALNRIVALVAAGKLAQAEEELALLASLPLMKRYYLFHATGGELARRKNRLAEAAERFAQAATLAVNDVEKRYLNRRANECLRGSTT